eukprot:scaffold181856_cov23-Tisochrysis_lutea.AAC.2
MTATHNTGVSGLGYGQVIFSSLLFPPPQQCPPVDGMHGARVGNSTATQRQRSNAGSGTPMLVGQQQLAQVDSSCALGAWHRPCACSFETDVFMHPQSTISGEASVSTHLQQCWNVVRCWLSTAVLRKMLLLLLAPHSN